MKFFFIVENRETFSSPVEKVIQNTVTLTLSLGDGGDTTPLSVVYEDQQFNCLLAFSKVLWSKLTE